MLDFKLDLASPLFMNVQAYNLMRQSCMAQRLNPQEAFKKLRGLYPDMNDLQFFEVDYEFSELRAIERKIERSPHLDYNGSDNRIIRQVLNARNNPEFSIPDKFIQFFGRGQRMKSDVNVKQGMDRMKRDGDKYLPRNKDHE